MRSPNITDPQGLSQGCPASIGTGARGLLIPEPILLPASPRGPGRDPHLLSGVRKAGLSSRALATPGTSPASPSESTCLPEQATQGSTVCVGSDSNVQNGCRELSDEAESELGYRGSAAAAGRGAKPGLKRGDHTDEQCAWSPVRRRAGGRGASEKGEASSGKG